MNKFYKKDYDYCKHDPCDIFTTIDVQDMQRYHHE